MQAIPRSILTLPEGYGEVFYLNVTDESVLAKLNQLGTIALIASIAVAFGWAGIVQRIGSANLIPLPELVFWGLIIAVLPLHEWIHGIFIQWAGQKPRYGMKGVKVGAITLPYLFYATTDGAYFSRDAFILIAITPLVVLSGLFMALTLIAPLYALPPIMIAFVLNASGAIGDLWMIWETRKHPPDTFIKDEADAIRIYRRVEA